MSVSKIMVVGAVLVLFGAACRLTPSTSSNANVGVNQSTTNTTVVANTNTTVATNVNVALNINVVANTNTNPPQPNSTGPLFTMEMIGGLCPIETCQRRETVNVDGTYTVNGEVNRTLQATTRSRLSAKIYQADWSRIRQQAAPATCPRSYDGQAPKFTFYVGADVIELDACQVSLDYEAEPFKTIIDIQNGTLK